MNVSPPQIRPAVRADVPQLDAIVTAAVDELLAPLLDRAQLEASRTVMGVDSTLIDDGTYLVAEVDGVVAGCGGWSRRAALLGRDGGPRRAASLLDPCRDPARIRAMYTAPGFARQGIGRRILAAAEAAAASAGFGRAELLATVAGIPLYEAAGYERVEPVVEVVDGVPIRLVRMAKPLTVGWREPVCA